MDDIKVFNHMYTQKSRTIFNFDAFLVIIRKKLAGGLYDNRTKIPRVMAKDS